MRRSEVTTSIRWTPQNRVFLEAIGYLDARTGRRRNKQLILNDFVNRAVSAAVKLELLTRGGTLTDCQVAWYNFQIKELRDEVDDRNHRLLTLVAQRDNILTEALNDKK